MELLVRRNLSFIVDATAAPRVRLLSCLFDIIFTSNDRQRISQNAAGRRSKCRRAARKSHRPSMMGPQRCVAHQAGNSDPHRMLLGSDSREQTMEIETMSAKILPAIVVGLLLGTTALASAQTRNYQTGPLQLSAAAHDAGIPALTGRTPMPGLRSKTLRRTAADA